MTDRATTKSLGLLCKTHHITTGSIEIGLDGKSALERVLEDGDPTPKVPSYDLILSIRRKIQKLPITIKGRHIEGHQDDPTKGRLRPIDRWGMLNIQMDARAKAYLRLHSHTPVPNHPFGDATITITFQGRTLASIQPHSLYEMIWGEQLIDYWVTRHKIPLHLRDQVAWDTAGASFKMLPMGKQRWLLKHLAGQCAVGRVLARRGHQQHDRCPLCDAEDEQVVHIVQCPDPRPRKCLKQSLKSLRDWMTQELTQPSLASQLHLHLQRWAHQEPPPPLTGPYHVKLAIHEQAMIGWENFLYGRFSTKILAAQTKHFRSIGKTRRTGKAWSVRLAIQAYEVLWTMWDHRNNIVHGTGSRQDLARLHVLRGRVQAEFAKGHQGLVAADRHLLDDMDTVMAYGLQDTRDWLNKIDLARTSMAPEEWELHQSQTRSRQLMEAYVGIQPQEPNNNN